MLKRFKNQTNKQYAIIGLGRFGTQIAKVLTQNGYEVLAVDKCESKAAALSEIATHTVVADASDEATLRRLAIDNFDVVIIAIGEDMQASIVCALCCKELGAKYIVAKASNEKHAKILEKIGINKIVIPEADSALRTAMTLINPHVSEIMELEEGYSVAEVDVPESWVGDTLVGLKIRNRYNINVLLVIRADSAAVIPEPDTVFNAGDNIIIGGFSEDVKQFIRKEISE